MGAYRTENAEPYVYPIVKKVEKEIVDEIAQGKLDKEYNPIDGDQDFLKGARQVLFGENHPDVTSGRVVSV